METFIPLQYYTFVYYNVLLLTVLLMYFNANVNVLASGKNHNFIRLLGILFVPFIVLYIGMRPIDPIFVDMTMYNHLFVQFADGETTASEIKGDVGFLYFVQYASKVMTPEMFFLICAVIYITPLVVVSFKWFKEYWFYAFLMLVISFSFLGYGVNGIRNGMATSLFLLAVSFHSRKVVMVLLLLLSIGFHKSMSLPICALALTYFHNDMRTYLKAWIFAIPISFVVGGFFVAFFTTLGFDDARVGIYLSEDPLQSANGFRWDFILYSATGVFAGWYYIVKKQYKDPFYERLLNVYLISNMFWILIIRAGFSNRFAYLSWFLLAIVIIYPLIKVKLISNQHRIVGQILFIYFMFTYLLNYLLLP
ncbi:MAG TPA: EpsG family protein [Flavobacterium sp.]